MLKQPADDVTEHQVANRKSPLLPVRSRSRMANANVASAATGLTAPHPCSDRAFRLREQCAVFDHLGHNSLRVGLLIRDVLLHDVLQACVP